MPARNGASHAVRNIAAAVLAIPVSTTAIVLGMAFMSGSTPPTVDCGTNLTMSQTALTVDLSSVPAGPIAGYGHQQLVNAAEIMLAAQKLGGTVRQWASHP